MAAPTIDARLLHVFQLVGVTPEEAKSFESAYNVKSFQDLLGKNEQLKLAKLRHGINRGRQSKLGKCVLWYRDYIRIYRKEPNFGDLLTDDALIDFEANDNRIPYAAGESLKHVFTVLHSNSNDLQKSLADAGILTFDDVIKNRKELEKGSFGQENEVGSIPRNVQKKLSQVVDWFDDFVKNHERAPTLITEFNYNVFEEFLDRNSAKYNLNVKQFYTLTKISIHEEGLPEFVKAFDEKERPTLINQIIEAAKDDVKANYMPENLHSMAPEWVDEYIVYWIKKCMNFTQEDTFRTPVMVAGETQSGKSAVKAIGLAVCRCLKIPSVVVSKGNKETAQLKGKLSSYANACHRDLIVGKEALRKSQTKRSEIKRVLEKGGAIVVADTKSQMEKLNEVLSECLNGKKFCVQIDEADAMYRTGDSSQKFEMEYDKLMAKRPCLRFFITATPVPAMIALNDEEDVDDIKFWKIEPCDDYIGVQHMCPLKDAEGNNVFLTQGDLKAKEGVKVGNQCIPYSNEAVIQLYRAAAESPNPGTLLLDITNPRVSAEGNIRSKAYLVQRYMKEIVGKDVTVVTFTGSGIRYRLPGKEWVICDKGTEVHEVLDLIDGENTSDEDESCDGNEGCLRLEIPTFGFGFSLMRRGMSYGSTHRRPTHLLLHMGEGHNIENVTQSLGRGTFIGKGILERNGYQHVTTLLTAGDHDMVRAYTKYVAEVHKRASLGEDVRSAMDGAERKLPAYADYLRHTNRRTGLPSKHKPNSFHKRHKPAFENPTEVAEGEKAKIKSYAQLDDTTTEVYRVAKICGALWRKNPHEFEAADIVDAYNDKYKDKGLGISKTTVTNHLKKRVVKDRLVGVLPGEKKTSMRYTLALTEESFKAIMWEVRNARHTAKGLKRGAKRCKAEDTTL